VRDHYFALDELEARVAQVRAELVVADIHAVDLPVLFSLFGVSIELAGVLGGGFAGAYTLGMFTRRANWQGVAIGVAVSIVLTTLSWRMKLVHAYFYLAISICLCIVFGYLASWFFPAPQSLEGLAIAQSPRGSNPSAPGK